MVPPRASSNRGGRLAVAEHHRSPRQTTQGGGHGLASLLLDSALGAHVESHRMLGSAILNQVLIIPCGTPPSTPTAQIGPKAQSVENHDVITLHRFSRSLVSSKLHQDSEPPVRLALACLSCFSAEEGNRARVFPGALRSRGQPYPIMHGFFLPCGPTAQV